MLFISCWSKSGGDSKSVGKITQDTLYDLYKGELVHESEDSVWFEPYEKKVPKIRRIFTKDKTYIYSAAYTNEIGDTLSNSKIHLTSTEERMSFAPLTQDKVVYEFKNYKDDQQKLLNHKVNKDIDYWNNESIEGVVENEKYVWIHPMRSNQYKFTEVAPFPSVRLPLEKGKQWESQLSIDEGWGEWSNTSGYSEYTVKEKAKFNVQSEEIDCWVVYAEADFPFGISTLIFLFNSEYGFVQMNYTNYENERLVIKLFEVKSES